MTFLWQIGEQKCKITLLDSVHWQLISFFNCVLINIFELFMAKLCYVNLQVCIGSQLRLSKENLKPLTHTHCNKDLGLIHLPFSVKQSQKLFH